MVTSSLSDDVSLSHLTFDGEEANCYSPVMTKPSLEETGAWNFRDIPRELMRRVKMAAAHEGKTVKVFLIELAEARLQELEKKGILPRVK